MRNLLLIILLAAVVLPARSVTTQALVEYSTDETELLRIPTLGQHQLRILSPKVLELSLVTTESPGSHPAQWNFVADNGAVQLPDPSRLYVAVNGKRVIVSRVGFKRRVLYAPLKMRDLRIGNWLYLELASAVPENAQVIVTTSDGNLRTTSMRFAATAASMRECPVIHVNQVGYATGLPKKAMVGYYLGSFGELDLHEFSRFLLIDAHSRREVYSGTLSPRPDNGWTYTPTPYQNVLQADFSSFNTPGEYRLFIPGLGCSLPFRIDPGIQGAFARAYALGLYHQRCGTDNVLPFTRFVHAPCHTASAEVPTPQNRSVEYQLASESSNYKDNPRHTAPQLKSIDSSLYPFVRQGKVDVSGGHHDAGDYSKYTINSAALIHYLVFAADNFPGAGELDNLGIPESGDGKSDLLQEAKWEADFLAKMQDDDGGFYFLVYPRDRAYENDVLPEHGDPQVVFPKTTSVTAAATAALAQISSSPRFRAQFPQDSRRFLAQALKGWAFLGRAWAKYGMDGSYQKITHYGDFAMHDDEIAWAAAELFLATGERRFQDKLQSIYDPSDPNTIHWGWERMFDSYGCAARSYAFGARSGRITESKLDKAYLAKCMKQILLAGQDHVNWYAASSYGTSFPTETKRFRTAGWYFSISNAFDIAVAYQLEPSPDMMEAIIGIINYEMGCNPINEVYLNGVGWKRQHEIVDQYALNDRQALPPSGIPLGSVQEGFGYLEHYKRELGALTFPQDGEKEGPYPFYDRWGDSFNLATEFTIPIQGRGMATLAWLMARSPLKTQPWRTAHTPS